jgi:hypothetical protein
MITENKQSKERHGCVSTWLIFIIIVNFITILTNIFAPKIVEKGLNYPSQFIIILYTLLAVTNILCAIMILKWKKWAFWIFIITGVLGVILNLYIEVGLFTSLIGLLGIPILYFMLQIKKDNIAAWENLE